METTAQHLAGHSSIGKRGGVPEGQASAILINRLVEPHTFVIRSLFLSLSLSYLKTEMNSNEFG